jgi:hypothetical protein
MIIYLTTNILNGKKYIMKFIDVDKLETFLLNNSGFKVGKIKKH